MRLRSEPLFGRLLDVSPFSERELAVLIFTAPHRYKDHFIDKRHGRGRRLISQPTAEVKLLQRLLTKHELGNLPLHDAAMAYRKDRSIKNHAQPHASGRYLLKLDFRDFFPSLTEHALAYRLRLDTAYSEAEIRILCQLLCRRPSDNDTLRLSIGAPSSPFVSNYLMWEFDNRLSEFCSARNARYTRYADDLAISTNEPHSLDTAENEVRRLLNELQYLGVSLNEKKTVNVSKKSCRTLAGLVLANNGTVSVGRDEKRRLRAAMHALDLGRLAPEEISHLRGKLAFVYGIDPVFVRRLCSRHGVTAVSEIGVPEDE